MAKLGVYLIQLFLLHLSIYIGFIPFCSVQFIFHSSEMKKDLTGVDVRLYLRIKDPLPFI